MHYRRVSYRYSKMACTLEPRPLGDVFKARLPHGLARPHWRPLADFYEAPDAFVVKVEIAGVADEALQVAVYEDTLVVEGERTWNLPEGVTRFHAVELPYGPFRLEVTLPVQLDTESVEAHCEQGLLLVRLPKRRAASHPAP